MFSILGLLQLGIGILGGVSAGLGKAGLAEQAAQINSAIDTLKAVHGSPVVKAQVDGLYIDPNW